MQGVKIAYNTSYSSFPDSVNDAWNDTGLNSNVSNYVYFKVVVRPKKQFFFSLDFKTMLTKLQISEVLSLDFKTTPVYFNWNFPFSWSAITNFKILRELERGENDSLV